MQIFLIKLRIIPISSFLLTDGVWKDKETKAKFLLMFSGVDQMLHAHYLTLLIIAKKCSPSACTQLGYLDIFSASHHNSQVHLFTFCVKRMLSSYPFDC